MSIISQVIVFVFLAAFLISFYIKSYIPWLKTIPYYKTAIAYLGVSIALCLIFYALKELRPYREFGLAIFVLFFYHVGTGLIMHYLLPNFEDAKGPRSGVMWNVVKLLLVGIIILCTYIFMFRVEGWQIGELTAKIERTSLSSILLPLPWYYSEGATWMNSLWLVVLQLFVLNIVLDLARKVVSGSPISAKPISAKSFVMFFVVSFVCLFICFMPAFTEEYIFRAFCYQGFNKVFSVNISTILIIIIFTFAHGSNYLPEFQKGTLKGVLSGITSIIFYLWFTYVVCKAYLETKSIIIPIIIHLLYDAIAIGYSYGFLGERDT